jgi:hypothetical protein
MLSELELKVIDDCQGMSVGAFFELAYLCFPNELANSGSGETPHIANLRRLMRRMRMHATQFDTIYFYELPRAPVNPLRVEQEAWALLSPQLHRYQSELSVLLDNYDRYGVIADLPGCLQRGWELVQKWSLISDSYKAKESKKYDQIPAREAAVRDMMTVCGGSEQQAM